MKPCLLDTGPIVAWLDRGDSWHARVAPGIGRLRGRLVTTGAVVTEAMSFLQDTRDGIARLLELLANPRIEIRNCFEPAKLRAAAALMETYADTPMDFADATLVVLAGELETDRIATLDERGFRTYRRGRNRAFTLVLQQGGEE